MFRAQCLPTEAKQHLASQRPLQTHQHIFLWRGRHLPPVLMQGARREGTAPGSSVTDCTAPAAPHLESAWRCHRHLLDSWCIQQVGQARPVDLQMLQGRRRLLGWKEPEPRPEHPVPSASHPSPWRAQPAGGCLLQGCQAGEYLPVPFRPWLRRARAVRPTAFLAGQLWAGLDSERSKV